jgi:hypothetical protein
VPRGQRAEPSRPLISVFHTGGATFLSSSSSLILARADWTPFQTHCYSENLAAPEIEPGTSCFAARKSDHRPQRRSNVHIHELDITTHQNSYTAYSTINNSRKCSLIKLYVILLTTACRTVDQTQLHLNISYGFNAENLIPSNGLSSLLEIKPMCNREGLHQVDNQPPVPLKKETS